MRDDAEHVIASGHGVLQVAHQLRVDLFEPTAIRDIAEHHRVDDPVRGGNVGDRSLGRKLGAVLPETADLTALSHPAR